MSIKFITSKANTKEYAENYDRIFGKNHKPSSTVKATKEEIQPPVQQQQTTDAWSELVKQVDSDIGRNFGLKPTE